MYCTIEVFYTTDADVKKYLSDITETYVDKITGQLYHNGKLNSLTVEEKRSGILIKGSLAKYYFGNNFETLTIDETKKAIDKINSSIKMDLGDATISRIDFATNFIVTEPPQNYYGFFLESTNLNRNQQGSTLYFSNKSRKMVFYDKCKEAKVHRVHTPDEYKNKNVLRYEYRLLKLKRNKIKLSELYSKNIFNWLVEEWFKNYNSIRRLPRLRIKKEAREMINLKAFEMQGWKLFIKQIGGIESFYSLLSDEVRRGTISKQNKYYYKKKFDEMFNSVDLFETNNLIDELDEKVSEAAERYRC